MVGRTISHYRILEKLGEGGMGVVYRAEDLQLKRFVALKCLPHGLKSHQPEQARFLQEAQAVAALNHPNICTIHEFFSEEDEQFIVMEYVEGVTLRRRIEDGGLRIEDGIVYAIQIGEALQEAHCHGIVHRDVKPDNIMLNSKNQMKVMDFGLAKLKGSLKLTKASSTIGTIAYMAPEQIQGVEVDARSDIFSFGIVFYEMLTGHLPFRGEHEAARIYSILNDEPEPIQHYLPDAQPEVVHLLNRALEKNPAERYQSMQDLLIDLRRLKKDSTRVSRPSQSIPPGSVSTPAAHPKHLSTRALWIAAGTVVVVLGVIAWFLFGPGKGSRGASAAVGAKSIAVMYFENRTDEKDLDRVLVDMLITNLGRNKKISVVGSQRLYDILKLLGKEDLSVIDKSTATEAATRAGAKTMLLGNIWKVGNKLTFTGQLLDVETGEVINSERVEAQKPEEIFAVADRMTAKVNDWLAGSPSEFLKIADATTESYEAYRYYEQGLRHDYRFDLGSAKVAYGEAIKLDSTFAMAYYRLSRDQAAFSIFSTLAGRDLLMARESAASALRHARNLPDKNKGIMQAWAAMLNRDFEASRDLVARVTTAYPDEKEGWWLSALNAWALAQLDDVIKALQRVIELDRSDANAYNSLAAGYYTVGMFDQAREAVQTYLALLPDVPNAYDTGWEVYTVAGRFDEALKIVDAGLKRLPDWYHGYVRQAETYLLRDDPDKAYEKVAARQALDSTYVKFVSLDRATFLCFEGRLREAIEVSARQAESSKSTGDRSKELQARSCLGRIFLELNRTDDCLREMERVRTLSLQLWDYPANARPLYCDYYIGLMLARTARYNEATARVVGIRSAAIEKAKDPYLLVYARALAAENALSQGKPQEALSELNGCNPISRISFPRVRMLDARVALQIGDRKRALDLYERFRNSLLSSYLFMGGDFFDFYLEQSKLDYYIGLAHEQTGDKAQAISSYQKALKRWKRADQDYPPAVDARQRLAGLLK